jgi:hypothetical protein
MMRKNRSVAFHLALAVTMKLAALTLLWWLFFRGTAVHLDVDQVADKIGGKISSQGANK